MAVICRIEAGSFDFERPVNDPAIADKFHRRGNGGVVANGFDIGRALGIYPLLPGRHQAVVGMTIRIKSHTAFPEQPFQNFAGAVEKHTFRYGGIIRCVGCIQWSPGIQPLLRIFKCAIVVIRIDPVHRLPHSKKARRHHELYRHNA